VQIVPVPARDDTPGASRTPAEVARIETPEPSRTPTASVSERTIGSLSAIDENQKVIVSGRIAQVNSFSKGERYTLDDRTGTITLLLWSDVLAAVKSADALKVGARVQAVGQVNLFNGEVEIVPAKGSDVTLLALSTIPTPAPRTIESLRADEVGTVVIIRGTASEIADFSQGKYVTLADGTGQIRVTVFSDVFNALSQKDRSALAVGAKLQVTGELTLYHGELELVPERGGVVIQ
jgi:exonuclease VII large subunit